MGRSDEVLLEQWQRRRDADAFAELVQRHSGMVFSSCKRILRDPSLAEDVAQECFVALLQTRECVRASLGAWLHRIAVRRSIDRLRSDSRRRAREAAFAEPAATSVERNVAVDELLAHVDEAIADLADEYKPIVIGRFLENRTHADIARDLEMPESTVRHRLERGVERIRESLRKQGITVAVTSIVAALEQSAEAAPVALAARLNKLAVSGSAVAPVVVGGAAAAWLKAGLTVVVAAALGTGIWQVARSREIAVRETPASTVKTSANTANPVANAPIAPPRANAIPASAISINPAPVSADTSLSISGRVYDAKTGMGIFDVRVIARPNEGSAVQIAEAMTDAEGRYAINALHAGEYSVLLAGVPGYPLDLNSQVRKVTLTLGEVARDVDFALKKGIRIAGTVVSAEGNPVTDAVVLGVTFGSGRLFRARSAEGGAFVLFMTEPSDNLILRAETEDAESATLRDLSFTEDGLEGVTLTLDQIRTASISGEVVLPDGTPMKGAQLDLTRVDQGEELSWRNEETDTDGKFAIDRLASGEYSVLVTPAEIEYTSTDEEYLRIHLEPGQAVSGIRIVYGEKGGMAIAGRVIDSAGKPVANADVICHFGTESETAHTDADGRFMVTGLENKRYFLTVLHGQEMSRNVRFMAGTMDAEIVLPGKGIIVGRVLHADTGEPVRSFSFAYGKGNWIRDTLFRSSNRKAGTNGGFEISDIEEGEVPVAAWAPGFAPDAKLVTIKANEETHVELRLKEAAPFEGMVVNQEGEPIAGATVYFERSPELSDIKNAAAAHTDAEGRYKIESLPDIAKTICAFHSGYGIGATPVRGDGRIVLPAEASIEGMVTREDATVDARVSISYREEPQFMSDHRRLAPDGTYRFTCLSPGTAVVRVSERNGPSVERAVTIQAGQNLAADFTIERGTGEVVGAILDNGHPVTDVQLELRRIDGDSIESRRVFVDGDGGFQFDEVPAGELTLELERGGELADDARRKYEVKMTLREGETITQKIDLSQLR
ncbi:MAG: sigma-70 family RNA polymerase sigma factor [Candidatus Hydrogenedentes bacterium]|nr:sigma-70 family RNA polymerase sigma factor [Candidatus Hydrogenedentota bacterium]